ncbi:MAG: hypothetical protein H6704_26450 [Myxococcales bacterium]|nr:hypothetical protein [Myxococcales bacterium]
MGRVVVATVIALFVGAGCSEPAEQIVNPRPEVGPDADPADDGGAPDAASEVDATADAAPSADAGPPPACAPRPPELGRSALVDRPDRCGQPQHTWLDDARLGEVSAVQFERRFAAERVDVWTESIGLDPPQNATHAVNLWRITYRSQDRGTPVEASALVLAPEVEPGGEPLEVILYLHNALGFDDACPPTALEDDDTPTGFVITAMMWAAQGRLVVAPDLLGIKSLGDPRTVPHPFMVGQANAIVALDAVRALNRLPDAVRAQTGCPGARFLAYGPAHGGHTALWVDRLAPHYAAELRMVGAVGTATPLDLRAQTRAVVEGAHAENGLGGPFLGLAGLWYGRPEAVEGLYEAAPEGWLDSVRTSCDFNDTNRALAGATFSAATADNLRDGGDALPWACIADENGLASTSVARLPTDESYGILLVYGEQDDTGLLDAQLERPTFEALCQQGVPLRGLVCAGVGQWLSGFLSLRPIDRFIDDRFAGRPLDGSCTLPGPVACNP